MNYSRWRIQNYHYSEKDITLQLLSYCFDGFNSNFYSSLLSVANLNIGRRGQAKNSLFKRLTNKLKKLDETQWKYALSHLRALHLLAPPESHRPDTLDCHPLVREYFAARLQHTHPQAWTEFHRRLYHYYKNLPEKKQPDTLAEMEPLFAAVAHGCRAGLHTKAWEEVFWDKIKRGNEHYSTKKLGAFGADLAALAGFFRQPWNEPSPNLTEPDQALALNLAGFNLRALGRLLEASVPLEASLNAYIKQKNWSEAANNSINLSELRLTLGQVGRAIEDARWSVKYADRSENTFWQYASLIALANAQHQTGEDMLAVVEMFHQAEGILHKRQPAFSFLYSLAGFRFCDLLLSRGHYLEVLKRSEETLKIAEKNKLILDIALNHLSLGRAHLQQTIDRRTGDFEWAAVLLEKAMTGLRQAGRQDYLPRALMARAGLYREMGDYQKAWQDLQEAQEIAQRGGMKLFLADYHLEAARLCGAEGKEEEAREYLERAKALIEETGYGRRRPEVTALEGLGL